MEGKFYARKIQIGEDLKDSCMTFSMGQRFSLGEGKKGVVEQIVVNPDGVYEIYLKAGNQAFLWKRGNMNYTAEFATNEYA